MNINIVYHHISPVGFSQSYGFHNVIHFFLHSEALCAEDAGRISEFSERILQFCSALNHIYDFMIQYRLLFSLPEF